MYFLVFSNEQECVKFKKKKVKVFKEILINKIFIFIVF